MIVQSVKNTKSISNVQSSKKKNEYSQPTVASQSNDEMNISLNASLKKFLDDIKNGTVSSQELKDMQTKLSTLPDKVLNSNDDMAIFLNKVKNGTVTNDDLTTIKDQLNSITS